MAHRTCTRYTERPIQAHSSFMRAFTFCLLVIYGRHLTQDPRPSAPSPKPQAPSPKPQAPSPKPQAPSQLSSPIKKGAINRSFFVTPFIRRNTYLSLNASLNFASISSSEMFGVASEVVRPSSRSFRPRLRLRSAW